MAKIGFSLQSSYALPMADVLGILKNLGLDAVSPLWPKDNSLESLVNTANSYGLALQSLHGPFRGLPGMWSSDEDLCGIIRQDLLKSVDDCARYDIPMLVVHSWGGIDYTFRKEDLYFGNFDALLDCACAKGVKIAFENLEGPEFLEELMTRYDIPDVGLCWDSGHEICYTPHLDVLAKYGDRLMMTHLNDNYGITDPSGKLQGTDDLHLIPYHGIANWEETVRRLKAVRPQEILNFELKIRPKGDRCKTDLYSKIPLEDYFTEAFQNAQRAVKDYFV